MRHYVSEEHLKVIRDFTSRIAKLQRISEGTRTTSQQQEIKTLQKLRNKTKEKYAESYATMKNTYFTVRVMRKSPRDSPRKRVKPRLIGYGSIVRPVFYEKGGYVSYEVENLQGISYRHNDPLHFIKYTKGPVEGLESKRKIKRRPRKGR